MYSLTAATANSASQECKNYQDEINSEPNSGLIEWYCAQEVEEICCCVVWNCCRISSCPYFFLFEKLNIKKLLLRFFWKMANGNDLQSMNLLIHFVLSSAASRFFAAPLMLSTKSDCVPMAKQDTTINATKILKRIKINK